MNSEKNSDNSITSTPDPRYDHKSHDCTNAPTPTPNRSAIEVTNQYSTESTSSDYSSYSLILPQEQINDFQSNGFTVFPNVFTTRTVQNLNHRLELVLRGSYDLETKPDKSPKLIKLPLPDNRNHNHNNGASTETSKYGNVNVNADANANINSNLNTNTIDPPNHNYNQNNNSNNPSSKKKKKNKIKNTTIHPLGHAKNNQTKKQVLQIINIHKSDSLFHQLCTLPLLAQLVSQLMHWKNGARLAQDQIWAKPPKAPSLTYHRDSPYFMFTPNDVCTVWIALDDMVEDIGPLCYIPTSHLWRNSRVGSSNHFFTSRDGGKALLFDAAKQAGVYDPEGTLEYVSMEGLLAGGMSIHDGKTWHGSSENKSKDLPRRGIGLHFVPIDVKWTEDAMKSKLWRRYVEDCIESGGDVEDIIIDDDDFPIVFDNRCKNRVE